MLRNNQTRVANPDNLKSTSGTGSTTAGLFTVGDPISGYGTVSGNVAITAGNLFVNNGTTGAPAGQTLTLNGGSGPGIALGNSSSGPGISINGTGSILDLQGNITVPSATNMNPSGSVIKFDGANISHTGGSPAPINNSGLTTSGTLDVVNASTLNNIAFSTGNGANLVIDAPLTAQGGATVNATNVTIHGTGSLDLLDTTGTTALATKNFTMAQGALLHVGAGADGISITGNFSFQQTNPLNWTYGSTAGLGPDLTMRGGTSTSPTTLEVGGINLGYLPAGFIKNFALASLTLGTTGYVDLVDQYANATPSGWTSGSEALYLDNLFGTSKTSYGTLNLDGLSAYLQGYGPLQNGIFTDANGNLVDIVGAPVPEPATITMMLTGFSSLLCLAAVRRRKSEIARATPYGACRRRYQPCP
jgi:hypothetical protein